MNKDDAATDFRTWLVAQINHEMKKIEEYHIGAVEVEQLTEYHKIRLAAFMEVEHKIEELELQMTPTDNEGRLQ